MRFPFAHAVYVLSAVSMPPILAFGQTVDGPPPQERDVSGDTVDAPDADRDTDTESPDNNAEASSEAGEEAGDVEPEQNEPLPKADTAPPKESSSDASSPKSTEPPQPDAGAVETPAPSDTTRAPEEPGEDSVAGADPGAGLDMLDMDLEQLLDTPVEVWTATKTKSTLKEAPAIMTVVTKEEIQSLGYRSVAEVLQQVTGFYIVDDHIIPNLGIRGMAGGFMGESGSVKVMINGYSVSFRSTGGNWLGPELVPMTAIERIEIIRGPASALYGADAFLGVVNIITRKGEDLSIGTMQGAGSITSHAKLGYDLDFALGARRGSVDIMLAFRNNLEDRSGLALPSSSPAPSIPSYNSDEREASSLRLASTTAHGQVTYHIKDRHSVSLLGRFSTLERGGDFGPWSQISYGLDEDGRLRGTTVALYQSMAGLQLALAPLDSLSIDWRIAYFNGRPRKEDQIDVGSDIYYVERDFGYRSLETSLEGRWQIIEDLSAVAGAEFIYDFEDLPSSLRVLRLAIDDHSPGDVVESSSTRQGTKDLYNVGAFVQAMWTGLAPHLSATGGIRYDNHNLYGNQISGRAGLISNPFKMLHLKLLYGSAFKAPSPLLLYGEPHQVGDIIGNPDLKPQKVHTVEGQAILSPIKFLSLSTGLAYNLLLDKAEFVQRDINLVAENISKVKSLSWESEMKAVYDEWISGGIGFERQWTDREFERSESIYYRYLLGNENVIYPEYILRVGLTGRVPKAPLGAGIRLMYVAERPSSEMNALENRAMYRLQGYLLLNASIHTVGIELLEGRETTISIVGRNLTNRRVADPGFAGVDYPLAPLTVFLQLRQEL